MHMYILYSKFLFIYIKGVLISRGDCSVIASSIGVGHCDKMILMILENIRIVHKNVP